MSIEVNWPTVCMGAIVLALGVLAAAAWCFLERARIAAEERRQRRAWEHDMKNAGLPEWDGADYEWTPETLAYLRDDQWAQDERMAAEYLPGGTRFAYDPGSAPTAPFAAVPASTVSGPLPVVPPAPDDFIARLRADNTAFLARLDVPAGF